MYGAQIAFREFIAIKGVWGSPWVGLDQFVKFFRSYPPFATVSPGRGDSITRTRSGTSRRPCNLNVRRTSTDGQHNPSPGPCASIVTKM